MSSPSALAIDDREPRRRLLEHPLYQALDDAESLRLFMRAHVFCVWDFQSLLTALQQRLTRVELPWVPTGDAEARRLVNEVVLEEESDEHPDGGFASHFEVYLEAMADAGAERGPILELLERLAAGEGIDAALAAAPLPSGAARFVGHTLGVARRGSLTELVAVFTHSREDMIPEMFNHLVERLASQDPERWRKFDWYLKRHIEVDGERHGPISHALLGRICGDDPERWREAQGAVDAALEARLALWDGILGDIRASRRDRRVA